MLAWPPPKTMSVTSPRPQAIYEDYRNRREGLLLALIDGARSWRDS